MIHISFSNWTSVMIFVTIFMTFLRVLNCTPVRATVVPSGGGGSLALSFRGGPAIAHAAVLSSRSGRRSAGPLRSSRSDFASRSDSTAAAAARRRPWPSPALRSPGAAALREPGTQFNREIFSFSFGMKNSLRLLIDSVTSVNFIFGHFS